MPLGIAATDPTNPYSGGDPRNTRSVWALIDNALRHEHTLFPTLTNGRTGYSSQNPRKPWTNILTPQPQEPGEFSGLFVFSDSTDRGYTFANPDTGGNYTLTVDGVTVDVRTATPSTFCLGGTAASRQVQAKLRASAHPNAATFSVSYSLATRKVTISNSAGPFDMEVKATTDASSCLHSLGYVATTDYTGADTYTGEEARFHTDDYLVMRLDPRIHGPHGSGAEFEAWRFLYQGENTFEGSTYLPRDIGFNLRFETTTDGVVNLDISGVPTDTDLETYIAAVGALLEGANSEGWRMTWLPDQERAFIDQSGPPLGAFEIFIAGDAASAWARLGFVEEFVIGGGDITAPDPVQPNMIGQRGSMVLYISNTVAGLTEQPDSAFTEGVDMFTLSHPTGTIFDDLIDPPAYSWRSAGGQWRRGGSASQRSRYWLADIAQAIGSAPTEIYAKLRIIDPNRTTPLSIGALGFSAGWWPTYNAEAATLDYPDRSTLAESVGGSLLPTFEAPRATARYSFGEANPLTADDASYLKSTIRAELEGSRPLNWIIGNAQPAVIVDPDRAEIPTGEVSVAGMAQGMAYGYLTRSPLVEFDGANRFFTGDLDFVEAV